MISWSKRPGYQETKGADSVGPLGLWPLALAWLLLPAPCSLLPTVEAAQATPPAINWVLPIFTDREGHRSMTLRGSEVRPAEGGSIAVTDLSITIFSGDADAKVDSILLSPSATFFPKEERATGEKSVRFIQDDMEVSGVGWAYDHAAKKVSIHSRVRVKFQAQINDILK
jgi:hypothetical protein